MEILHKIANRQAFKLFFIVAVFVNMMPLKFFGIEFNPLFYVVMIWGGYILLHDLFTKNLLYRKNHLMALSAYGITLIIATLFNSEYAGKMSLAIVILQLLIFLLVFAQPQKSTLHDLKQEIRSVIVTSSVLCFLSGSISLLMFFFNISLTRNGATMGIVSNRLFGVYFNCNPAAFLSCMIVVFGIIALRNHYRFSAFYIVNIIVQVIYVILSNSRSALLILALMVVVMLYYTLFKRKQYSPVKKFFVACLSVLVIATGSGIVKETLFMIPKLQGAVFQDEGRFHMEELQELFTMLGQPWANHERILEVVDDIYSSRVELWYESYQIWKQSPMLGIGVNTFQPMGQAMFPDSKVLAASQVTHTHNVFLETLVTGGMLGFICFFFFTFKSFTTMMEVLRKYNHTPSYLIVLLLNFVIWIEFIGGMLDYGVFYVYSLSALLFWMFLGYLYRFNDLQAMHLIIDHQAYEFISYRMEEAKYARDKHDDIKRAGLRILHEGLEDMRYTNHLAIVLSFENGKSSYFTYEGIFQMRRDYANEQGMKDYRESMALELYDIVKQDIIALASDETWVLQLPFGKADLF